MKIYSPNVTLGDYELSLGVFSTQELAENAIHEFLRKRDEMRKNIDENNKLVAEWKKLNPMPSYKKYRDLLQIWIDELHKIKIHFDYSYDYDGLKFEHFVISEETLDEQY